MATASALEGRLAHLTTRAISESVGGSLGGGGQAASEPAVQDAQATYSAFLLDPRGACKPVPVPIYRIAADLKARLLAVAGDAPDATAAAELCDQLLSICRTNGVTAQSIEADRRQQRFGLDWPYSEAVPDCQPRPADEQCRSYRQQAAALARAMRPSRDGGGGAAGETLADPEWLLPGGQLAAVAEHPSLHFLAGWLAYKTGQQHDLQAAVRWFSSAAAHPLLRTSCLLLRGLALYYLQHPAAQQELEGALALDAQANAACRAEPAVAVDAHSALVLLHASRAGIGSASRAAASRAAAHSVGTAAEGGEEAAGGEAAGGGSDTAGEALALALASYEKASSLTKEHVETMMCRLPRKATAVLDPHLPDGPLVGMYRVAMASWGSHEPGTLAALDYHRQRAQRTLSGTAAEQELGPYDSAAIVERVPQRYQEPVGQPPMELPQLPASGSYCQRCGAHSGALRRCARCQRFCYCGRACQAADWPTHKAVCRRG